MKLREIFRFEITYQSRRVWTWLYAAVLLVLTYRLATEAFVHGARSGGYFLNSPFIIASVTIVGSILGSLMATALAGGAGARDVQTRMHPLVYTTPVGEAAYLRGRFLAAFVLNALLLVAVPIGLLIAALAPRAEAELLGPFQGAAYLGAYVVLAVPNAFIATSLLFSLAVLSRRTMTSYLGSLLLVSATMLCWQLLAEQLGRWRLATLLDPFGLTVLAELSKVWTPIEKNTLLVGPQGSFLANRVLWIGIALGLLALTHLRFRFAHHTVNAAWSRAARQPEDGHADAGHGAVIAQPAAITVPRVRRTFGVASRARQTLAVAGESFRQIATSWGGRAFAGLAALLVLTVPSAMEHLGVPLRPTTAHILPFLAAPLTDPAEIIWVIVPLLIVFYAGELVWREREARLSEIADAAPVPDWVFFVGKLLGLGLVLVALQALMMAAGMLIQVLLGYHDFEIGLYLRILFGLQLADYLLLGLLAVAVHVLVDHRHGGHLVMLVAYLFMAFGTQLGIEHNLLVYGSDPGRSWSDLRGFEPFLGPWLWFKLYWAAWALLLAIVAKLFWARGRDLGLVSRLRQARRRFTGAALGTAAVAVVLILTLGGFILYNTNVLNAYETASDRMERRAGYERRYGQYRGVPQPHVMGTRLHVEIHPGRRAAEIRGTYHLVNRSAVAIDSIHLTTAWEVQTGAVRFDRPARCVLADEELGHRIYRLEAPLRPGDSMGLDFEVRFEPRGFPNRGIDASVVANGTYFTQAWLPAIGYQTDRELDGAGDRRAHGLPPRPAVRSLDDVQARQRTTGSQRIAFEAVVGTQEGQVALAPGALRRTWTENGRRYFHYVADAPIRKDYAFFSAAYAVHPGRWNDVSIQIFHHPDHPWNLDRMVRGVQASLAYYTAHFGPYPHGQIRLVEHPGAAPTLHAFPINISYQEGFALFDLERPPRSLDFPFAVVAHEVAHQWWGNQLTPALVEGAPVLTESLAWYSAMAVVEDTYGAEHLRRLLDAMREAYLTPRARADVPLLRANDPFLAYRKGPFAMYALREHIGGERVNVALRRLLEKHGSGEPPLPTSLDLYRELQAVTPAALRPLLADLFEANTFWELAAERVTAQPGAKGTWQVTLDAQARKVVVDSQGVETEIPMDDLIEVGVFAAAKDGGPGQPLYLRKHRVRSGEQRITVTVPGKPARAGIDPRSLLIDVEAADNLAEVLPESQP